MTESCLEPREHPILILPRNKVSLRNYSKDTCKDDVNARRLSPPPNFFCSFSISTTLRQWYTILSAKPYSPVNRSSNSYSH